jgi:hypothetical protein
MLWIDADAKARTILGREGAFGVFGQRLVWILHDSQRDYWRSRARLGASLPVRHVL